MLTYKNKEATGGRAKQGTPRSEVATGQAGKCPSCGRVDGACREVPMGHFCQRDGLTEDTSRRIVPTPDPLSVAVHASAEVVEAHAVMEKCRADTDQAHGAWIKALQQLATHNLQPRAKTTSIAGVVRYRRPSLLDIGRKSKLLDAEDTARQEREDAVARSARAFALYDKTIVRVRDSLIRAEAG